MSRRYCNIVHSMPNCCKSILLNLISTQFGQHIPSWHRYLRASRLHCHSEVTSLAETHPLQSTIVNLLIQRTTYNISLHNTPSQSTQRVQCVYVRDIISHVTLESLASFCDQKFIFPYVLFIESKMGVHVSEEEAGHSSPIISSEGRWFMKSVN